MREVCLNYVEQLCGQLKLTFHFFSKQLRLIHIAVEQIKDGICSGGCDIHHLLTKLHPKFDILRFFLLAMCAIVLLAVVSA